MSVVTSWVNYASKIVVDSINIIAFTVNKDNRAPIPHVSTGKENPTIFFPIAYNAVSVISNEQFTYLWTDEN